MIRQFTFDGQTILLPRSPVLTPQGESLFAADSMTLFVGVNGAGKTRALAALASIFSKKKSNKGDAIAPQWDSIDERAETCAIYYTPVPFPIDVPKDGHNFRCIQPSWRSREDLSSVQKREVAKELEKEFGLEARRVLSLFVTRNSSISHLSSEVLNARSQVVDPWTATYRDRNIVLNEAWQDAYRRDRSFDSPDMKQISAAKEKLSDEFTTELRERIGAEFALRLRAYGYAREQPRRSLQKTAELQLLEGFGFLLNVKLPKKPTVARQYFDEALQGFRSVAAIVGDSSLERSSYQVDEHQIKNLDALPLGKLGKVSLASLSSGAAALIDQFTNIKLACEELLKTGKYRRLLLLIDEGDAFLHLGWQQQYVEYLDKTVSDLKSKFLSVQVVVASHSPILMSDFPRECIFHLNRRDWIEELFEGNPSHIPKASFAAPLDVVVRDVGQAGSLGTFATRIIRKLVQDVSSGVEVNQDRVAMIDDPVIRRQISRLIEGRRHNTKEV